MASHGQSAGIPSPVVWITGLPDDDDDGELEMRLARVGDLIKLEREDDKAVATFKHTKAAVEAREKLNGFSMASGRTINIVFAEKGSDVLGEIDSITGQVIKGNRELHWKIGQLVRSTYSAMRQTNGNYPPPKQVLVPEDFRYLSSPEEALEMESRWEPSMPIEDKLRDYEKFADRRPFHNRYVVLRVAQGNADSTLAITDFVKSMVGELNVMEVTEFDNHSIVHCALKSTRDASIVYSTIFTSLQNGEGGLVGRVHVESVHYGPPVNMANSVGKLWFGCSAFLAIDEDKLRTMLSLFGEIENLRLIKNKNCMFVSFNSEENAIRCRNKLFAFEIAPGHFLNVDFAPPAPEIPEGAIGQKRRYSEHQEESGPKRHSDDRSIRLELSKMGERMCGVLARKFCVQKSPADSGKDFYLPREVDICNRTKVDYCRSHLEKLGATFPLTLGGSADSELGTVVVWQFAAASEKDCSGYDALCDYFVSKERVGFFTSKDGSVVTYFIPPVKEFLDPLGLAPDTRYLTAIQMPAISQAQP